jgi:hypothetical protein
MAAAAEEVAIIPTLLPALATLRPPGERPLLEADAPDAEEGVPPLPLETVPVGVLCPVGVALLLPPLLRPPEALAPAPAPPPLTLAL